LSKKLPKRGKRTPQNFFIILQKKPYIFLQNHNFALFFKNRIRFPFLSGLGSSRRRWLLAGDVFLLFFVGAGAKPSLVRTLDAD
jgi:hypothetical protein